MKSLHYFSVVVAVTLPLLAPTSLQAMAKRYLFEGLVQKAELIVEGVVIDQKPINRNMRSEDPFHYRFNSDFLVSTVHKGAVHPDDVIEVHSHLSWVCNTSCLKGGQRYLLFLKRSDNAWHDLGSGQGTRELIQRSGETFVLDSNTRRSPDELRLDELVHRIREVTEVTASQPASQGLTADDAREIARQLLSGAAVDLAQYEVSSVEHLTAESEMEGVASKGDPIWKVEWKVMNQELEVGRAPPASPVGAYIHVRTARTRLYPDELTRKPESAEEACRLFLKRFSYWEGQKIYGSVADKLRLNPLDESVFNRYWIALFNPRARIRPYELGPLNDAGTRYFRADFECRPKVCPLVVAVRADLTVIYAGVLDPWVIRSDSASRPAR